MPGALLPQVPPPFNPRRFLAGSFALSAPPLLPCTDDLGAARVSSALLALEARALDRATRKQPQTLLFPGPAACELLGSVDYHLLAKLCTESGSEDDPSGQATAHPFCELDAPLPTSRL